MRIRNCFLISFFLCWLSLAGCSVNSSSALTSQNNGISATLSLEPSSPVAMENTTFTVKLMKDNQPVKGAEIILNLTMPGMKMPQNRFNALENEPGSYSSTTLLSMAGDWHLQANVAQNKEDYIFDFDFKAR